MSSASFSEICAIDLSSLRLSIFPLESLLIKLETNAHLKNKLFKISAVYSGEAT